MDQNTKKIIQDLKKARLSIDEKFDMRKNIVGYIDLNRPEQVSPYVSKTFFRSYFQHARLSTGLAFAFLFVFTGSTIALAAEKSLPGDLLYPVKTQVSENILRAFNKITPADTVAFETGLMEKRLVEAEDLEKNRQLNQSNEIIVQTGIINQENRVQQAIARLSAKGNHGDGQVSDSNAKTAVSASLAATSTESTSTATKQAIPKIRTTVKINADVSDEKEQGESEAEDALIRVNTLLQMHKTIIQKICEDTLDNGGEKDAEVESSDD